uniref:NADH-ubiquinone oxidoreductase chain 4L n=1 Tax=Aphyocharax rathbuni TaxID=1180188 RepID=A0A7S6VGE9_9TELE|nr:NADH dehydrogenase subunit 4L [Aphyocharax rathbuni]
MSTAFYALAAAFTLGVSGLALHRTHLISALLCLEGMMLSLFITMGLWALQLFVGAYTIAPMFLLAIGGCEAAVGLSLVTAMARTHKNEKTDNLTSLKC